MMSNGGIPQALGEGIDGGCNSSSSPLMHYSQTISVSKNQLVNGPIDYALQTSKFYDRQSLTWVYNSIVFRMWMTR
jgi:hypothetical protein